MSRSPPMIHSRKAVDKPRSGDSRPVFHGGTLAALEMTGYPAAAFHEVSACLDAGPIFQVSPPHLPVMALVLLPLAAPRPSQCRPGLSALLDIEELEVDPFAADRPLALPRQATLLSFFAPVTPLLLVTVHLPQSCRLIFQKIFSRLDVLQPGFAGGVNRRSPFFGTLRVVFRVFSHEELVGEATIRPQLDHFARRRSCTSKLNSLSQKISSLCRSPQNKIPSGQW